MESPKGKEFWAPHVEALQRDGKTQRGYAQEHGLSVNALGWWYRKMKAGAAQPGQPTMTPRATVLNRGSSAIPGFVSLKVAPPAMAPSSPMTLRIGDGVSLQLSELPSASWIAEVHRSLQGPR